MSELLYLQDFESLENFERALEERILLLQLQTKEGKIKRPKSDKYRIQVLEAV